MINCKEASRLMSEGLDRDLDLGQRMALRLHLLVCTACSRVKAQVAFLRKEVAKFPGPEGEE